MTYILVLLIYAGPFAKGDSVALTQIEFNSLVSCTTAGRQASQLVSGTAKDVKFICVEKSK